MQHSPPRLATLSGKLVSALRFAPLVLPIVLSACSPLYVLRAGYEEARILSRRRPIAEVLEDAATDTLTRRKLELVVQARTFAAQQLDLDVGESFTTFSWVEHDTLLMVLSAVRKDRFQPHTWWFPIVGHVPYKGYFDFEQAYDAAAELEKAGFDTHVRPSGAFSTLGWFNDPLLNTVLRYSDVSLASTVIHELVHNTIFVPSQVSFNESFANFVGDRGAAMFFCERDGAASPSCTRAQAAWSDNLVFGEHLTRLVTDLETVYNRTDLTREEKIRSREAVFTAAAERFTREVNPRLLTNAFRTFHQEPLNNATLIATRLYYDRLHLFESAFEKNGRDLPRTIKAVIGVVRGERDPFGALENYIGQ